MLTPKQRSFLRAYAKTFTVAGGAAAAKVGRRTVYDWLQAAEFKLAFEDARETAADALEAVAIARASMGERPSDLLLMFLLKGLRPEKYRDNASIQHTGAGGAPISIQVEFVKPE